MNAIITTQEDRIFITMATGQKFQIDCNNDKLQVWTNDSGVIELRPYSANGVIIKNVQA